MDSYVLEANKWLEVTLSKSENVSSVWIKKSIDWVEYTLTIEWSNQMTQSTIKEKLSYLIKLQGGQTTSTIKIKSNKKIAIRELILFGWRRSEMIDFVVTLFFLFVFNVLDDNQLEPHQQKFKSAKCDEFNVSSSIDQ